MQTIFNGKNVYPIAWPEQRLVPGIKITYLPVGNYGLSAVFHIGLGVSSKGFLANKEISGEIQKFNLPSGQRVGYMIAGLSPSRDTIFWQKYSPTAYLGEDFGKRTFVSKGLAQLSEYRVLQKFKVAFPSVKYVRHAVKPSTERKVQVYKRGHTTIPDEILHGYPFERALKLLREKIARDTLKGRGITPRPLRRK